MWDFDIGRTLGIMARTWPFIALRLVVYFAITLAYILATGTGAGVGYGLGRIWDDPGMFALFGGFIGFGLVSAVLYWLREYILYLVKAGHVAVIVHLVEGREVPEGRGQIDYATSLVRARFAEASVLFVVDQLIKGVLRVVTGLIGGIANALPIPGLQAAAGFANSVIRISLTYVDEIILGYNIREGADDPFDGARRGLVLYAQNGGRMVKNAVWLALFMWLIALVIFLLMLGPAAAVLYLMPGALAGWSFALAIVFAWAIKAALLEPFAIAALMQVYFRTIEGQVPDPDWDRKLSDASRHFRELKDRAASAFGGRPAGQTP
ncbi:MAG: hypothetical protein M9945_07175 [Aquamicrobium sp.]|uniref:hypothetical protein n=1 Tax=Aquamicrobium sp. TaxID=1872579 RepID=UPI00349EDAD3|nr:hypothetical protein [Aquamicrobium sp.]